MLFKKELTEYNRYQAFAIHMALSLVIFFILLVCITLYWYPGILFDTGNGWKAIGIIVGIDLILGPLLTLIVFNHNKNTLKLDLAVIALIQIGALAYGTWTIHQTRPTALVFMSNKFVTFYQKSIIGQAISDISSNNDYLLFHKIDSENTTYELTPEQFTPFKTDIINVLPELKTHSMINEESQTMIFPLDPHVHKNKFIEIDSNTGEFISIVTTEEPQSATN